MLTSKFSKIYTVIFSAALVVSLAACGGSESSEPGNAAAEQAESMHEASAEDGISGSVLMDNEYAFIEITETSISDDAYEWKLDIENKSDQDFVCLIVSTSINDIMIDADLPMAVIGAGESISADYAWDKAEMNLAGITDFTKFGYTARLYTSDVYDEIVSESGFIYPLGEEAVLHQTMDTSSMTQLIDKDDFKAWYVKSEISEANEYGISLYYENNSDQDLLFLISRLDANGTEVELSSVDYISADMSGFTSPEDLYFQLGEGEEHGVASADALTELKTEISVYDTDSNLKYSEVVSLPLE